MLYFDFLSCKDYIKTIKNMVNFSFQWHLKLFIICSVYEKGHMSELRTKNRSERDLLSCEVTSQLRRSLSLLLFIILLLQLPAPQQSAGRDWGTFSLLSPSRSAGQSELPEAVLL